MSYLLAVYRDWEPYETDLFKKLISPGATVLDVGAHIGYFTLLASTLAGPAGRVFAFEPEPRNRALLEKNARSNQRANVMVVPKGVSDKPGKFQLHLNAKNKGAHSLFALRRDGPSVEIETLALGPWMKENGVVPDFIKMDVEGGEWLALAGMSEFLEQNTRLTILLEYFPEALRRSGREPREWLDKLTALCFRLHYIDEAKRQLRAMQAKEIEAGFTTATCNLLCVRD